MPAEGQAAAVPAFPLAAFPPAFASEKPHQGVSSGNPALHRGFSRCKSRNALGLREVEPKTRVRSFCSGEQFDPDLQLYYLRARYLNALTGRFLTRDSADAKLGDPTTFHRYLYAGGNPVNLIDPSGRQDMFEYTLLLKWTTPLKFPDVCLKAPPLPANSPKCDGYGKETYLGVSLKCFCKCAGDSSWSQQVRGCLACEHDHHMDPYTAHERCYMAAGLGSAPYGTLAQCYKQCFVGIGKGK